MTDRTCSIDGCERQHYGRSWCKKHYQRWWTGSPIDAPDYTPRGEPMAFYLSHVDDQTDDCVLWPYGLNDSGYGMLDVDGSNARVHVLACAHDHGPCPDGMEVCHAPHDDCGNRHCFNPRHLRWGTKKENAANRLIDGTHATGERSVNSKLTDRAAQEIRDRYARGGVTQRELANTHGVSQSTASLVVNGKRWMDDESYAQLQIERGEAILEDEAHRNEWAQR